MTMDAPAPSKEKKGLFGGLLGGAKSIWGVAIGSALLAVFGSLTILGNAAATTTYFVLNQDIPARTQITADMLMPVETSIDGAPVNAFDPVDIREGTTYSKIALSTGDLVTASNAGPLAQITDGLPGNFVAASFAVTADSAVAGKVSAGDYIDVIATSEQSAAGPMARVVMHNVLVLDVTVAPDSIAQAANEGPTGEGVLDNGPESRAVRNGIPSVYTVGVSPEDAAKLAIVRGTDLMVVLTSNAPAKSLDVTVNFNDVFAGGPVGDSSPQANSKTKDAAAVAPQEGEAFTDAEGVVWTYTTGVWQGLDAEGNPVELAGESPEGYPAGD